MKMLKYEKMSSEMGCGEQGIHGPSVLWIVRIVLFCQLLSSGPKETDGYQWCLLAHQSSLCRLQAPSVPQEGGILALLALRSTLNFSNSRASFPTCLTHPL